MVLKQAGFTLMILVVYHNGSQYVAIFVIFTFSMLFLLAL